MSVQARLESVFKTVLNDDSIVIDDNTSPADFPLWDSMAQVNLIFAVEQEFGIQFSPKDFAELENVSRLKRLLVRKGCA